MDRSVISISKKILHLSEAQLVELDLFVDHLQSREHDALLKASMALSEPSLAAVWNNPEDDAYDAL